MLHLHQIAEFINAINTYDIVQRDNIYKFNGKQKAEIGEYKTEINLLYLSFKNEVDEIITQPTTSALLYINIVENELELTNKKFINEANKIQLKYTKKGNDLNAIKNKHFIRLGRHIGDFINFHNESYIEAKEFVKRKKDSINNPAKTSDTPEKSNVKKANIKLSKKNIALLFFLLENKKLFQFEDKIHKELFITSNFKYYNNNQKSFLDIPRIDEEFYSIIKPLNNEITITNIEKFKSKLPQIFDISIEDLKIAYSNR